MGAWAATLVLLFGFDTATALLHRSEVRDGRAALLAAEPGTPEAPGEYQADRKMLAHAPREAVVFCGNSVVQTAVCPPAFARGAGMRKEARCLVLGLSGETTSTLLEAIVLSSWHPAVVVADLSPRIFGPFRRRAVQALLGVRREAVPARPGTPRQVLMEQGIESRIHEAFGGLLPSLLFTAGYPVERDAVVDGMRHGYRAYVYARAGNFAVLQMEDGSHRIALLNDTPGYERFRTFSSEDWTRRTEEFHRRAEPSLAELLDLGRRLASAGTKVIFVRMPLDLSLRERDDFLHRDIYARFEGQVRAVPGLEFADLGADPVLQALPFYDGHHRAFDAARRASEWTGRLLAPLLPQELKGR